MVSIPSLWLPILLSAVLVWVASSVIHMVLSYHRSDYRPLPDEEKHLAGLGQSSLTPGLYVFPYAATPKDMGSPEMIAKYERGPVGYLTILPSRAPAMPKFLVQWFLFCIVIGIFVAYVTGRTLAPGTDYLQVFRVAGTVAWLGYAGAEAIDAIWMGQSWTKTLKNLFDGLVYALLTAGVFGWLWPS